MTRAVFFDVDFTLIYPGPTFQGVGYQRFCEKHGIRVDPSRFNDAVKVASAILDDAQDHSYSDEIFIRYTGRIIEEMGGAGPRVADAAGEIYAEWAACQHFFLYEDVVPALRLLDARGLKIGLISNSHRSLASFEEHFELSGLIDGAISSHQHGFLKPHPSIFEAALELLEVEAGQSVMVGDSYRHDIEGARSVGMRGLLVSRSPDARVEPAVEGVPVIRDLGDVARYL